MEALTTHRYKFAAFGFLGVACTIASLALIGWQFDIADFRSVFPGIVAMNPVTALCFLSSSVSLFFFLLSGRSSSSRTLVGVVGFLLFLVGALRMTGIVGGAAYDVPFDQLLFHNEILRVSTAFAKNRIAPNTSLNFMLFGAGLMFLSRGKSARALQSTSLLTILIAILAILGYLYNVKNLYGFLSFTPMALNTAINFLSSSLALCFATAGEGFMAVFTAKNAGGLNARRLLPMVVLVPSVLGFAALSAVRAEYFNTEFAFSLLAVVTMLIFTVFVFFLTASLNTVDREKAKAEDALKNSQKKLELANEALDNRLEKTEDQNESLERTKSAMLNIMEDLQEERNKLEIAKAKDEALLSSIGEGLVATDRDGKVLIVNRAAADMIGYAEEEIKGKFWALDVPHVKDTSGTLVEKKGIALYKVLASGKGTFGEYSYERKDGTVFPVYVTAAPVIFEEQTIGGIVVFRDVTKEKEVDRAKTEFVSLASHQLRTPLSAINWYVEMLLAGDLGELTPEQKENLQEVADSNRRMVDLVGSLLNVSRIDLGTFAVEPQPTNLIEVAESILKEVKPQYEAKKQTLTTDFAKDLPILSADPKLVRIVFQNYLTNAIKYTGEGGVITFGLRVREKEQDVLVSMKDNGYGIPKAAQGKIFSKLFRADNVREKETDGTGLGLYIIKAIIEQSGGKVWFESEENKGSTFYASIPLSGMKKKAGTKGLS